MREQIDQMVKNDLLLLGGGSVVLVAFLATILMQVNGSLPSELRILTVGAAAVSLFFYLEIVGRAALELRKKRDFIYGEELECRGNLSNQKKVSAGGEEK